MEGELIYVAIIMQLGTIITLALWSSLSLKKYFKKENFKTEIANVRAGNKMQLKKLERELGLKPSNSVNIPTEDSPPLISGLSQLSQLAPLLKNLDGDQISGLIEKFTGGGDTVEGGDEQAGGIGAILDQIPKPLIDNFLAGLKGGADEPSQDQGQQEQESQV